MASLMLAAWALAWLVRDPFVSDWDGFDYAAQVIQATPSPLGLGRALFLGYNQVLWQIAHHASGLSPEQLPHLMKYAVIAQSGLAVAGLYALYREITQERLAAIAATLAVMLSPIFIIWSGRGMSEIPGVLMFAWSLCWAIRSARAGKPKSFLIAAILFGLSANMREFSLFYLPVIPLLAWHMAQRKRQWWWVAAVSLASLVAVFAGPLFWLLKWPAYYLPSLQTWYALSAQERREHPVSLRNLWVLLAYAIPVSPVVAPVLIAARKNLVLILGERSADVSRRLLLLLSGCGLLSMIVLIANHDLSLNPRYLLTGLLGIAPLCGQLLAERWRMVPPPRMLLVSLIALTILNLSGVLAFLHRVQWPRTKAASEYRQKIQSLPDNAVFIVGRHSPLIDFYRRIGARPEWRVIAFGSAWPDERLGEVIDQHRRAGRAVYVDFDPQLWDKTMRDHSREAPGLLRIQQEYKLIPISGSLMLVSDRR